MRSFLALVFVLLWSSAFISSKYIVEDATPFAALAFRFAIVGACLGLFTAWRREFYQINTRNIITAGVIGILFHSIYLGGVFYAIAVGMSASIAALIVSLQPVLTSALAGPVLGEQVGKKHWFGMVFGFMGASLVIGFDIGDGVPLAGIIAAIFSLIAATAATLLQKKTSGTMPLSTNNFFQALAASLFLCMAMFLLETPHIDFTPLFIAAMSWQIIAVSFGAFSILLYLLHKGSASQTSSLFFLVPPITALLGRLLLDEIMLPVDIAGLVLATMGVYIVRAKA